MAMAARKLELEFFEKMGVYTRVTRDQALASGKGKVIQGRWIDVNKGSSETPDYRSRYVGKEFNRGQAASSDLYAATPPLEALKLLVSTCATEQGRETHLMLSDVKRAYFHAPATRELYVELPDEDPGKAQGLVGKLNLSLYGTRDAAANWQKCVTEHFVGLGFQKAAQILACSTTRNATPAHWCTGTTTPAPALLKT